MDDAGALPAGLGPILRREDERLLVGAARYVDDIEVPRALHLAFVRSPHAHARLGRVDTAPALSVPGVVAAFAGRDLGQWVAPLRLAPPIEGLRPTQMPVMPVDKVRFVGDLVACVIATSLQAAADGAERVAVDYGTLEAVVDMTQAAEASTLVDDELGTNLVSRQSFTAGTPDGKLAAAHRVVTSRFSQHRQTHMPLEGRGCIAAWDRGRRHLTMHVGVQAPHPFRSALAARLGLSESQVTVVAPDMGGGFGQKVALLREELIVAAVARRLDATVRWREQRGENLIAALHAREETIETVAAVAAEGRLLALKARMLADFGAYCFFPANYMARVVAMILPGPYRLADYAYEVDVVLTNKCPAGPMRAPMAITSWVIEGTMDAIARELDLDPLEVRRVNLIGPADLPYVTATGESYRDITPAETQDSAARLIDYPTLRRFQAKARAAGRLIGIGICNVVESTTYGSAFYKSAGIPGSGHETAWVRIEPSGAVNASVGLMGSGQGYETTIAQCVGAGLGVTPDTVNVLLGHTDVAPYGMGSRGSRGAAAGGGVAYLAARRAAEKVLAIAAHQMGLNTATGLRLNAGSIDRQIGAGWEPTGLALKDIARIAYLDPLRLPAGMEPGLDVSAAYDPPAMTYSNATHLCVVEIDRDTGHPTIVRYLVVGDSGTPINQMIVDGQMHGAIAMGLSGALKEMIAYDAQGQNLTGSLMDYAVALADDLPSFEVHHHNTANRLTPLGIKGMAEGGTMGAIGAIANAVNDALAPLGCHIEAQPLTAERIWRSLRATTGKVREGTRP
jgi:carbon-monoxide dehydrogenase large subunit